MLDNAYRQDIVTRIYVSGLNYNVNSSKRSISHNYAAEFLRFGIFPPQISDSCGAIYQRNCKMFEGTSTPLTDSVNSVQIDA